MLKIAKTLELPTDFATQTVAILARKRVGKTYTASVIAEECCEQKIPFVVLDPTGAWYGLRSSKDGKSAGYPVIIMGGAHGDIPLEFTAGKLIAEFVVENPGYYVLDLSGSESDAEQDRFATAFAQRLYRLKDKHREPLHLFVDEADSFAPQNPFPGQRPMLGAFEAIVRRGGIRGIGITMITQRPAVLNKNVLTQSEVIIALQTTGPQDIAAVDAWIKLNATAEQRKEFLVTVASLGQGEAWVWSPAWLEIFEKVKIRERRTFNSSATPKVGEKKIEPAKLAEVDLHALSEKMAATLEKVKADDPKELKKQIGELKRELAAKPATAVAQTVEVVREVLPAGFADRVTKDVVTIAEYFSDLENNLTESLRMVKEKRKLFADVGARLISDVNHAGVGTPKAMAAAAASTVKIDRSVSKPIHTLQSRRESTPNLKSHAVSSSPAEGVSSVQQKVLDALALCEALGTPEPPRINVAFLAGYTVNGHFNNIVGSLNTAGLINYPRGGHLSLTEAGRAIANSSANQVQTLDDFHSLWRSKLSAPEVKILNVLLEYQKDPISRELLAEKTGYTINGHFNNMVGHLKTLGAATYPKGGHVAATDVMFPEGLV